MSAPWSVPDLLILKVLQWLAPNHQYSRFKNIPDNSWITLKCSTLRDYSDKMRILDVSAIQCFVPQLKKQLYYCSICPTCSLVISTPRSQRGDGLEGIGSKTSNNSLTMAGWRLLTRWCPQSTENTDDFYETAGVDLDGWARTS